MRLLKTRRRIQRMMRTMMASRRIRKMMRNRSRKCQKWREKARTNDGSVCPPNIPFRLLNQDLLIILNPSHILLILSHTVDSDTYLIIAHSYHCFIAIIITQPIIFTQSIIFTQIYHH